MKTLPGVKRGDTWKFVFSWKNDNTPIDLTDCTARMQVRAKRTGALLAEATSDDGHITIEGLAGNVNVEFPHALTNNVAIGTHDSDLEITFPDGTVQSSSTVQIVVEEDITR